MGQKDIGLHRPFALLGAFCVGVICLGFQPTLVPQTPASLMLLVGVAGVFRFYRQSGSDWRQAGLVLVAALAIGLGWANLTAGRVLSNPLPVALEKKALVVEGMVTGLVQRTDRGSRFDFRVDEITFDGQGIRSPGLIRLSSYQSTFAPTSGERWRMKVKLKRPHGITNPGAGFHQETWMFQKRLRARGYVISGSARRLEATEWSVRNAFGGVNRLRETFHQFVQERLNDPVAGGIVGALTVGVRSDLGESVWRVLQDTGTIHLVAISGLHIGLVSMMAGVLVRLLARRVPVVSQWTTPQTLGVVFGVAAGFVYALLAGFTLPTRRALAMVAFVAVALVLRRRPRPWPMLLCVLSLVLAIDPLAPFSSSLWLSFGAVASLMLMTGRSASVRIPGTTLVTAQVYLFFGMLPVVLYGFQKASLVAPLGNLLAIPVIGSIVVPLGLIALASWRAGLEPLAGWLLDRCEQLISWTWVYLEWLAGWRWAVWFQGDPGLIATMAGVAGAILLLGGKRLPGRWLGILWMLPMVIPQATAPASGEFRLIQLDVGQGLASIVQTHNHSLLFDAGAAYPGGFNLGSAAVNPALRHLGVDQLDRMVISHGDNDHVGGALEVSRVFQPRSILTGTPGSPHLPGNTGRCHEGQRWSWDGVNFEMLWPPRRHRYQSNNRSCVMRISNQHGSLLLTGDIEALAERSLLRTRGSQLASDVLVVPHHGSKTSSTRGFLARVSSRLAIASAGYLNRFGHPAEAVVDRYRDQGIALLNTAAEGAITVNFTSSGIEISGARAEQRGFWKTKSTTDFASLNGLMTPSAPMVQSRP